MGVTGLWRLIEPAGKPVPIETLENKVLAVDISIWLHQMVKGYQDAKGAPLPNAHLIGLFQRLCKLLYFRIKPVFVFDGAFPALKRETITKRQKHKQKYNSESERLKRELAILLTKKTAISSLLGKQVSPTKKTNANQNDDDIFKLPALPEKDESESESEDETSTSSGSIVDLHTVDLESENFKSLQPKEKYDLLLELKETRKMNSWGKLHELPKKSDNFSDFQLQRLLKRRKVQECLEETEKEIGDAGMSLNELESLLNEEGIDTKIDTLPTKRIASNNTTRYLLINDVKQALADAKKKKENQTLASTSKATGTSLVQNPTAKKSELEDDLEKAIKMSLECTNEAEISACTSKTDDSWTSYMSDSEHSNTDSEEEDGCEAPDMTSAKAYIMQYCDFTDKAIDQIVSSNIKTKTKNKKPKLNEILEEINNEKSVIVDNVELSSSDDEGINQNTDSDVRVNTTIDSDIMDESVDATQASVVVIENKSQEVITLDSSLEESPVIVKHAEDQVSSASIDDLDHVTHKQKLYVSTSDIHTLTKTSLQLASDNHNNESSSCDNDFDVFQKGQLVAKPTIAIADKVNVESDSSDNDFEDVPEIDNKPVVQLTLKINETPEDDIFADVFTAEPNKIKHLNHENIVSNIESKREEVFNQEDDEELQKAIMMSLECAENSVSENNVNEGAKIIEETHTKHKEPAVVVTTDKAKSKPSKTLESLNEIISAQSSKDADKEMNKLSNETTREATNKTTPISTEQLNDMVEKMQTEEQELLQEKGRMDRVGRNITEQMTKEAQELLQIFGIPYIIAPMEAEAQCAFLESVNLTEGTITDDSDIWLFGGRTVYKNFFNQKKHVLQYLSERIEKSFNLSRDQLILLALLVGSDYTTGISGVGPVTALEILASFPFNKRKLTDETNKQTRYMQMITGLQEFKQWVKGGKRTDNTSLKKKLKNISLNDDFPSVRVVQAYLEPNIEKSEDKFSWGEIDITILRDYTKAKFGWSQHKSDEIIKPVLKRLVERKSQKSMHDFFKKKTKFQSLEDQMSKRVRAAVQKMGPELPGDEPTGKIKTPGKRKASTGKETKEPKAGPSKSKKIRTEESVLKNLSVQVVSEVKDKKSDIAIKINKTDRFQEIIPQREKDKQSLLQNKMKAIEVFRKTNIDKKKKNTKRKPILPKERAELSESSDSN